MHDQTHRPDSEIVDPTTAAPAPGASPPAPESDTPVGDYDEAGVPTLEHVRNKIESRYATAAGAEELAAESAEGRSIEEQMEAREKAARERLEQLRRSLGTD